MAHAHNLVTKTILASLPPLRSTDGQPAEQRQVLAKFFAPWGNWTWYVLEASPEDGDVTCFGLFHGNEAELTYFSVNELQAVRGRFGLRIERDLHWRPITYAQLRERLGLD